MFKKIIDKLFKKPQFNSVYAGPEYYKRKPNMGRVYAGPEIDEFRKIKESSGETEPEEDDREYPKNYETDKAPEGLGALSDDKAEAEERASNDAKMLLVYAGPEFFKDKDRMKDYEPPVLEKKKPSTVLQDGWICGDCGAKNTGDFCTECGRQSPQGENRREIT
ncbi:MAG: hypothetical protein K6F92_04885 [Lachnospiraceae bacterium]|nr:hypothetical protein [Lachnospiraceae bacterium]